MWQSIIAYLLAAGAIAYAAYSILSLFRKDGKKGTGCASCTADCPLRDTVRRKQNCPEKAKRP